MIPRANERIITILRKIPQEELAALQHYYLSPLQSSKPIKKSFTKEEDDLLRAKIAKYGENWKAISAEMAPRSIKQCRERWTHYLSPNLNKSEWTEEEDAKLQEFVRHHGTKWSLISKHFSHRTDTALKNRWLVLMRKRASAPATPIEKNSELAMFP